MDHLYYYLTWNKKYSEEKAKKTIYLLGIGGQLPADILKDVREYNKLMEEANKNTLFNGVEI